MYTVLDASMLGIPRSLSELAPLCAARGIAGLSAPGRHFGRSPRGGGGRGDDAGPRLQWG